MAEKKGFLGFFKGNQGIMEEEARQRDYALSIIPDEAVQFAQDRLAELLALSGLQGKVVVSKIDHDKLFLEIVDSEDFGLIIGRDGATLEGYQTLIRAFLYKKFGQVAKVILDAGSYRLKRQDVIKNQALKAAQAVIDSGHSVELEPMNAAERRMVHVLLQDHSQVQTTSTGEGPQRRVVIEKR